MFYVSMNAIIFCVLRNKRLILKLTIAILTIHVLFYLYLGHFHVTDGVDRNTSYVTLCSERLRGDHRIGNHIFMLSAMIDLALKTKREIIMPSKGWNLDKIFDFDPIQHLGFSDDLKIGRYEIGEKMCPCELLHNLRYEYDYRFNQSAFLNNHSSDNVISSKTLEICGLSQTFMYGSNPEVENKLRLLPRLLKGDAYAKADVIIKLFKKMMKEDKLGSFVLYSFNGFHKENKKNESTSYIPLKSYLNEQSMTAYLLSFFELEEEPFFVGVHVRMGDFLHASYVNFGLTVADAKYFQNAFAYFINSHENVLFAVLSDDIDWAVDKFPAYFDLDNFNITKNGSSHNIYNQKNVKIVFFRDDLPQDFAILCRSDALVISTGTFGWWAAWFNKNAPIIYYDGYPRKNSGLGNLMKKHQYYPKEWIPML